MRTVTSASRSARLGSSYLRNKYTPLVKDISVASFDAYLKENSKIKKYLSSEGFSPDCDVAGLEWAILTEINKFHG